MQALRRHAGRKTAAHAASLEQPIEQRQHLVAPVIGVAVQHRAAKPDRVDRQQGQRAPHHATSSSATARSTRVVDEVSSSGLRRSR